MSRQICSHTPQCPKCRSEAKRSDVPYGHASMLLLGEGSEATEPYNKYANLFKYISKSINLINPFGRHFCRPCDRRHIVAQMAGDEMSLTQELNWTVYYSHFSHKADVGISRIAFSARTAWTVPN